MPLGLQSQDSSYWTVTLRGRKCIGGVHISGIILRNNRLSVNQTTIGYTTHEFGRALATRLDRAWPKHPGWPVGLTGIVVDSVVTVAGPPVMGRQAGIGRWGLWLAPRAGGLAGLVYAKSEGSNP